MVHSEIMHIPDGFLDTKTAAAAGVLSITGLGMALRQTRLHLPRRRVPLMGLSAAFIFAAQMLNFPVAGGTSGHLIGGVLASVLLGPSAAIVVIAAVLIVQCLLFADGGVMAIGANIFNMGIISSVGGYYLYRAVWAVLPTERGRLVAIAFSSWCATVIAAIVCAGELVLSHKVSWRVAFPAMTYVHMLIGIGEGLLTTLIIAAIARTRPDLLKPDLLGGQRGFDVIVSGGASPDQTRAAPVRRPLGEFLAFGLLIAMGLALFVSPLASKWPDGLDHVAEKLGFKNQEISRGSVQKYSPMAEYQMPRIGNEAISTGLAGGVGTIVAFGLALLLARVLVPKTAAAQEENGPGKRS